MTEWRRDGFTISTDPAKLDRGAIHEFLSGSYWATGISREVVDRSIDGSLCFGVYDGDQQLGFARVITDFATFAYLADVYVLESHRRRGLAAWLMESILAHPGLRGLRRWMLVTRDAHPLYRKFGFRELAHPERIMEMTFPGIYEKDVPHPIPLPARGKRE
jgi:GNAT superfamily N-acetyltransferase